MYTIVITSSARKELSKFEKPSQQKIANAISSLADDPRPRGCIKMKGKNEDLYRIRVGDFRIIYNIDDGIKVVEIRKIGDRKDVYDLI